MSVPSGLIQLWGETIVSYSSAISAMRRLSDRPLDSVSIITTSVTCFWKNGRNCSRRMRLSPWHSRVVVCSRAASSASGSKLSTSSQ